MSKKKPIHYLIQAIDIAGNEPALARAAGVSQPTINMAKSRERVGPKLALAIHRATGGAVRRSDLCPEYYPHDLERDHGS